jgi:hypothetical protein
MKRTTRILCVAGSILAAGVMAIAHGQNDATGLTDDERLLRLERLVLTLDSQLQQRTSVVGPDDRITRDFHLDTRLDNNELHAESLSRQVMDLQRALANAQRIADQALREAQMAQQTARAVEIRSR